MRRLVHPWLLLQELRPALAQALPPASTVAAKKSITDRSQRVDFWSQPKSRFLIAAKSIIDRSQKSIHDRIGKADLWSQKKLIPDRSPVDPRSHPSRSLIAAKSISDRSQKSISDCSRKLIFDRRIVDLWSQPKVNLWSQPKVDLW
jgi:hypothetical protein